MMNNLTSRSLGVLRQLRYAALLEGTTLIILLAIAVPLKHFFDYPGAVQIIGPLHGLAFLLYFWLAINTAASEKWKGIELFLALGSALIPLGGFFAARYFWRQDGHMHNQRTPTESNES